MNIKEIFYLSFQEERKKRANSQLTIGKLLEKLKSYCADKAIKKLYFPHSYRGYYSDLALQISNEVVTVSETIDFIENKCLNVEFRGYKGGDFIMDIDTPIHISEWGASGTRLMSIIDGDILDFETEWENE